MIVSATRDGLGLRRTVALRAAMACSIIRGGMWRRFGYVAWLTLLNGISARRPDYPANIALNGRTGTRLVRGRALVATRRLAQRRAQNGANRGEGESEPISAGCLGEVLPGHTRSDHSVRRCATSGMPALHIYGYSEGPSRDNRPHNQYCGFDDEMSADSERTTKRPTLLQCMWRVLRSR